YFGMSPAARLRLRARNRIPLAEFSAGRGCKAIISLSAPLRSRHFSCRSNSCTSKYLTFRHEPCSSPPLTLRLARGLRPLRNSGHSPPDASVFRLLSGIPRRAHALRAKYPSLTDPWYYLSGTGVSHPLPAVPP